MTVLYCVPSRCGLPVRRWPTMGSGHALSGMLRRGRLRRRDLPQANWLEGFTSKRTSHLLGMCPTGHAMN
jgi:hypothetical protein